jgi:signal transduction histidine kinase
MDSPRLPLLRRLDGEHPLAVDGLLTVLVGLVYAIAFKGLATLRGPLWANAAIGAIAVLPAAFRRRQTLAALISTSLGQALAVAISTAPAPPLAVALAVYTVAQRFERRMALMLLACALAITTAGLAVYAAVPHPRTVDSAVGPAAISALLIAGAWLAGSSVRQRREYARSQREQAERRAAEQVAEMRRMLTEQRLQIARDLHDVLAHTLSLIAVQAGVANYVIGEHPEEASRALSSIEQTSRSALGEVRALLTVLRAERPASAQASDSRAAAFPAPGLADLGALVERTAAAGVRVDLQVSGRRPALPAGIELAAFRVVQEAITNVVKHAATDACQVTVAYQQDRVTLQVTDHGSGVGSKAALGYGIVGMRERVGMYGGDFHAGALPDRGFQVTARSPVAVGDA